MQPYLPLALALPATVHALGYLHSSLIHVANQTNEYKWRLIDYDDQHLIKKFET